MSTTEAVLSARLYRECYERIIDLVAPLDTAGWNTPVPACPAWTVRDVVAHLVAVAQEWCDGRLSGVPTDAQTAAQVARFGEASTADLLVAGTEAVRRLNESTRSRGLVAPVGDIVSHEHDIRGALGRPGARDSVAVGRVRPVGRHAGAAHGAVRDRRSRRVPHRSRRRRRTPFADIAI